VAQQKATLKLQDKACPAWYVANAHKIGYYEVHYDSESVGKLLDHSRDLTLAEEVGVLGDLPQPAECRGTKSLVLYQS
jgi:hypothetical protein